LLQITLLASHICSVHATNGYSINISYIIIIFPEELELTLIENKQQRVKRKQDGYEIEIRLWEKLYHQAYKV
jgi:hypothetical protein